MSYIIDATVISELLKKNPDTHVANWAEDYNEEVFFASVTIMELQYGIMRMGEGKRKDKLSRAMRAILKECNQRIYDFDSISASFCATLRFKAYKAGFDPRLSDCMIAAICQRNNATLVTHNVEDFEPFGIDVFDPWNYESPTLEMLKKREREESGQLTLELPD